MLPMTTPMSTANCAMPRVSFCHEGTLAAREAAEGADEQSNYRHIASEMISVFEQIIDGAYLMPAISAFHAVVMTLGFIDAIIIFADEVIIIDRISRLITLR